MIALRETIKAELGEAYLRIYGRKLPPILTTHEVIALGVANKPTLDAYKKTDYQKQVLKPLPAVQGSLRRYLLSQVVDYLATQ